MSPGNSAGLPQPIDVDCQAVAIHTNDMSDEVRYITSRIRRLPPPVHPLPDDDAEEQQDAGQLEDAGLFQDDSFITAHSGRNQTPQAPQAYVPDCRVGDHAYTIGDTVELNCDEPRRGDFLLIVHIVQDLSTDIVTEVRGLRIRRHCHMKIGRSGEGMLDFKLNETHMILSVDLDDQRPVWSQALIAIAPDQILCRRRMILTNASFGNNRRHDHSFRDENSFNSSAPDGISRETDTWNNRRLVCRWVLVLYFPSAASREAGKYQQAELRKFSEDDLDTLARTIGGGRNIYRAQDHHLYLGWKPRLPGPDEKITFGDGFCGGGGASEAAQLSGAIDRIVFAFDHDADVLQTYRANRSNETAVFHKAAQDMVDLHDHQEVMVLHLSPPCQTFSSAHTYVGVNDDMNSASLFAVLGLIRKYRPRLCTIEQTACIISHHPDWFSALINMFTSLDYSVRWQKVDFRDYGLAQQRSRLVIFASCPGSSPPAMPPPTHGQSTSRPWRTINDVLRSIPRSATHNTMAHCNSTINRPPYSGNTQAVCITRGGGDTIRNYHPSGNRAFTIREFASLQGFRHEFVLPATKAKHIIGNAVPPSAMAVLFSGFREHLNKEGARMRAKASEVIVID